MMRKIFAAIAAAGLVIAPLAVADDFPDSGSRLRNFDPKRDCSCVFSALKRARYLRDGYKTLAESYKDVLKELGTGWVDPDTLDAPQIKRLIAFNKKFDEEELAMARGAPASDCGFPEDKEIVLKTSSISGNLPGTEQQKAMKPLFPFEELFDAVMRHEAHHSAQFSLNNTGKSAPAGKDPKARTPYRRALEEAEGYAIEVAELEKLEPRCKVSFEGVKINMRSGEPPNELVITNNISGYVCGDPHSRNWTVTVRTVQSGGGVVISDVTDPPWETDCVEPGGFAAEHYEKVIKNSPRSYLGWYCLYSPGPPAQVTLRTPKLTMGMFGMEMKIDPPESRSVDAKVGACEEKRSLDTGDAPVPVS